MLKVFLILQLFGLMLDTSEAHDVDYSLWLLKQGRRQQLCGRTLTEVLSRVCNSIYASPNPYKKSVPLSRLPNEISGESKLAEFHPKFGPLSRFKKEYPYRGITEECCRQGCDYDSLSAYCGYDSDYETVYY